MMESNLLSDELEAGEENVSYETLSEPEAVEENVSYETLEVPEPTEAPEPIVINTTDYSEQLESLTTILLDNQESIQLVTQEVQTANNLNAGMYATMLFTVGVGCAVLVLILLNNFIRRCY